MKENQHQKKNSQQFERNILLAHWRESRARLSVGRRGGGGMCDAMSQRRRYTHQGNFFKEFACPGVWARALTLCPCPAPLAGCRGCLGLRAPEAHPRWLRLGALTTHPRHPHPGSACGDLQATGGKINQVND